MQGNTVYDHDSVESKGPTLRTGIPEARWSGSFYPVLKICSPTKHQLYGSEGILYSWRQNLLSLSALDYVDCMDRTLGQFYQRSTRVKTFGNYLDSLQTTID